MNEPITAVTGSTRCGTTMVMRMLAAGGMYVHADNLRSFESADIMRLPQDTFWLGSCRGKALKLLEPLYHAPLPASPTWRFILMRRNPFQQARSQNKVLSLVAPERGVPSAPMLEAALRRDYKRIRAYLESVGPVLVVQFENVLAEPGVQAERIARWLKCPLDTPAMAAEVRPRSAVCYPGLLETDLPELALTKGVSRA